MTRFLLGFALGFLTFPLLALAVVAWVCAKGEYE